MSVAVSFIASQAAKELGMAVLKEVALNMAMKEFQDCKQSLANRLNGVKTEPKPKLTFKQRGTRLATQALHEAMNSRALQNGMQSILGSFGVSAATASFVQANQEDLFQKDKAKSEQQKKTQQAQQSAQASQRVRQEQAAGHSGLRR